MGKRSKRQRDDKTKEAVVHHWRSLVHEQSSKIGTLANNVVLPKNERKYRALSQAERMEMLNMEAQRSDTSDEAILDKTFEHFPAFMVIISITQIILFYSFGADLAKKLGMIFAYDPHRRHEIWRFISVMLVHSDYAHLWDNVIMQLILGVLLEIVHKWKRIGIIYLASVVGGSLCLTVLDNKHYAFGASAGVMGLLFSHLGTMSLNWNEMDRKFTRLFCVSLYIFYSVSRDVYTELILNKETNIGHAGHFGGAITGFLVSILVLKNFKKRPWEEKMQKICAGILIALFLLAFLINVTAWGYFPENHWNFDYENSLMKEFDESTETYDEDENTTNTFNETTLMTNL